MKIKVVYHSKTGNTKKVADAIAAELNVTALSVSEADTVLTESIDLLFIGDGMYYGGMDKSMKEFIKKLDPGKVKCAAVFATSGGSWPMGPSGLQGRLKDQGIKVQEKFYKCHGGAFGVAFATHPDEKDLAAAQEFARAAAEKVSE